MRLAPSFVRQWLDRVLLCSVFLVLGINDGFSQASSRAPEFVLQPIPKTCEYANRYIALSARAQNPSSVIALGEIRYQWFKDQVAISGATRQLYEILELSGNGDYYVTASNNYASTSSNTVRATILPPGVLGRRPSISEQPKNSVVFFGDRVEVSVTAAGTDPMMYKWQTPRGEVSGYNLNKLEIRSFSRLDLARDNSDRASYYVNISNDFGGLSSDFATVALRPRLALVSQSEAIRIGSPVELVADAEGNAVLFQWYKGSDPISPLLAAVNTELTSDERIISKSKYRIEAFRAEDAGSYSVRIQGIQSSAASQIAGVYTEVSRPIILSIAAPPSILSNLSIRTRIGERQILTVGAVRIGEKKDLLIRAVGPSLRDFGVVEALRDPLLELYAKDSPSSLVNDDWMPTAQSTFDKVGAFRLSNGSRDAALVGGVAGPATVQASGKGEAGVVLVEMYDIEPKSESRLVNVSARSWVGNDDNILIAGFAIAGSGRKDLLIRAVGPSLARFGIQGFLTDPTLRVLDSKGNIVASNDDWDASLSRTFTQAGAFPFNDRSKDAASLVNLTAGTNYTVQVIGANRGTGEALVEIYELW